jgi:hypothetical protein
MGNEGSAADMSDCELDTASELLEQADPLAETRISLSCPGCDHEWAEPLDIGAFLWEEIASRAKRLLVDVHALATAYGWTESEILSLSDSRRAFYRSMAQA